MTVLLVRHGESTWNVVGLLQGQTAHPDLTGRGRDQARAAAAELAPYAPTVLWTSDLTRAARTAAVLEAPLGLTAHQEPLLRERHWGELQGGPGLVAEAVPDRPPGGESDDELQDRVRRVLAAVAELPGPVVLVTHGEWIRQALVLAGRPAAVPANGAVVPFEAVGTPDCLP